LKKKREIFHVSVLEKRKKVIENFEERKAFWWPDPSHQKL